MEGKLDDGATRELLAVFRKGSNDEASDLAAEVIRRGVSPQSVWDAIHCGAAELLMRQPGILALHAVTAADGRRYAFQACGTRTRESSCCFRTLRSFRCTANRWWEVD